MKYDYLKINRFLPNIVLTIVVYLTSLCINSAFFSTRGPLKRSCHSRFKGPRVPKKAQFTHERLEYNV
jgi:hypothetical protein